MKPHSINILLVEDDPTHAEIVRRSFEGFRVANRLIQVGDGQAALDYLQQQGSREDADQPLPNLILLDLHIPKIDGLEVLRILKSSPELREIPVVVLATSANTEDIAKAYDLGANSYLVKPADFVDFCERMSTLRDYWLAWNHYPH